MASNKESDAKYNNFLQWVLLSGIQINGVILSRFSGCGMGMIAI